MNKNNTIPTLAITRLAPRLAAHPASWLALGLTVAALSLSQKATAGDHETEWAEARAELDPTKRRDMYTEMQQILRTDGGVVLPMFANYVQAVSNKIANPEKVGNLWQMDNARMAERWWTA